MKYVRENINEVFIEDSDPIKDLGIGMRHLIAEWLKKYKITNYHINKDLTINVYKFVDIDNAGLKELPSYIQFNRVKDYFNISYNSLTTMRGFPKIIYGSKRGYWGNLWVTNNKLTSLEYSPSIVEGNYNITSNKRQFTEEEIMKVCQVGKNVQFSTRKIII
jgi:hypothetical protein